LFKRRAECGGINLDASAIVGAHHDVPTLRLQAERYTLRLRLLADGLIVIGHGY